MKILIAGMQRSASTFTFNVARMLLEKSGKTVTGNGPAFEDLPRPDEAHYLHKTHYLDPDPLSAVLGDDFRIIISYRKPIEAIASWVNTFGFALDDAIDHYERWFDLFGAIRNNALCLPFEEIERKPQKAIKTIAQYIDVRIGLLERWRIASTLRKARVFEVGQQLDAETDGLVDVEFSQYDPRTFFHVRHIKSLHRINIQDVLSQDDIAFIESKLGDRFSELPEMGGMPKL